MRSWSRKRLLTVCAITLVALGLPVAFGLYYNPFWLIDRGTDLYLYKNGIQHRQMLLAGHRIHYLEAIPPGPGPEKPIVLVHGLGARASDWAVLTPSLARHGYHVYALDLLGYGTSEKPKGGDFSLAAEEAIVAGFIDNLHLQQTDLAGWSMGGWIASKYALDHPTRVRRLLLYDSAGLYMPVDFPLAVFAPRNRADLDQLIYRIEPDKPHIRIPGFAVPGLLRRFGSNAWVVDNSLSSMLNGREILDFRIHKLTMPVLLVWGTEDKLTPFSSAQRLHELVPQSVLVGINGCGHLTIAECASQAVPITIRFLNADPPLESSAVVLPSKR